MKKWSGVLLAVVALSAVLCLGVFGYGRLSGRMDAAGVAANNESEDTKKGGSDAEPETESVAEQPKLYLKEYDATVYDDAKNPVRLTEVAGERPLVMNFWATWCPYCIQEMPDFQRLVSEYGDRVAFAFVDQTDGQRETVQAARDWVVQNGFEDLPVYYDTDLEASSIFAARALPTTVIVAADGQILAASSGMIDLDTMRSTLDSLVQG